eukprot:gnl/TRDRNA2_/TRDRNA2_80534_c0_seq1.p1 gnl/TRDRNA2_/TRDRNA2_80534_c0~~gnl/TRDRNA2_/TRDRNA2_80534_c0_seq1.p1  ORF type:complete len:685 (-),score=144.03 gnl/TRDRNA2_/TRDRNA2_80534_c0_seq1:33-2087(-)
MRVSDGPSHWPPEDGYAEALRGWHASPKSQEWLFKPATRIYFHTPTQTLWKKSRYERSGFARVDVGGLQAVTLAAFGETKAGLQLLLRAAFFAWQRQKGKFEAMDRDIAESAGVEATMASLPRTSAPGTSSSDRVFKASGSTPSTASLRHMFPPSELRTANGENDSSFRDSSSPSRSSPSRSSPSKSSPSRGGDCSPLRAPVRADSTLKPRPLSPMKSGFASSVGSPGSSGAGVGRPNGGSADRSLSPLSELERGTDSLASNAGRSSTRDAAHAAVGRTAAQVAARCDNISAALRMEVLSLETSLSSKDLHGSYRMASAWKRVSAAVAAGRGGEELRAALLQLRAAGVVDGCKKLNELMIESCALEEAQIVVRCLQQALNEADRMSLELWLEQAIALRLEALTGVSMVKPVRRLLAELEELERRAAGSHASNTAGATDDPSEQLWRQCLLAVEANDEHRLMSLISEAQEKGIGTAAASMLLQEMRERKRHAGNASESQAPAAGGNNFLGAYQRTRETLRHLNQQEADRVLTQREMEREHQSKEREEREARERQHREQQEQREREERRRQDQENWENRWRRERDKEREEARQRQTAGSAQPQPPPPPRPPPTSSSVTSCGQVQALKTLGLPAGQVPSLAELKAAYRTAAMQSHPDRQQNHDRREQATEDFQRVKAAFDLLVPAAR